MLYSDDIHETTYEQTKTPATYHSPEPIIKKTVVNRELVSESISSEIENIIALICYIYLYKVRREYISITVNIIVFFRFMAMAQHLVRSKLPLCRELRGMSSTSMNRVCNLRGIIKYF